MIQTRGFTYLNGKNKRILHIPNGISKPKAKPDRPSTQRRCLCALTDGQGASNVRVGSIYTPHGNFARVFGSESERHRGVGFRGH